VFVSNAARSGGDLSDRRRPETNTDGMRRRGVSVRAKRWIEDLQRAFDQRHVARNGVDANQRRQRQDALPID